MSIEKTISQYVEKQFPAFYHDEGPQFVSFVKAYYEWLEQPGNVANKARHLLEYRDIDTTLDEFILYFKEKYLKNIQFDTATNKQLLVKHSLDLYRSKGTERSIDLFFKLVFGASAEVQYPGERIFKLSDGVWEVPNYLEITYNKYNINYVGRQIIGSASGATAFVERYIRRRVGYGYVNMLYISNQVGTFTRGEVIGIQSNGRATYTPGQTAAIVGSVDTVILQDNGRDFAIGDIINFQHSPRGVGGLARVTSTGEATGLIDFILHEGGWGYTTNATSIVSEKVITANSIVGVTGGDQIKFFDTVVQPTLQIEFTDAPTLALGDIVQRYDGANVIANGVVIELDQISGQSNGTATISVVTGPLREGTLYVNGNTNTLNATSIVDTSTYAEIMGVPSQYQLTIANATASFTIGMNVYQTLGTDVYAYGTVSSVSNNILVISAGNGDFSNGDSIHASVNSSINAVVVSVDTTMGLYQINKRGYTIDFVGANNNNIANSAYLFQYDITANVVASGFALHSSVSSNAGTIEYIPLSGQFQDLLPIYTSGNTAMATISVIDVAVTGGDFVEAANAHWQTLYTNAHFTVSSISEGTGAQFDVGTIGESEVLFIGTDIINSNNTPRLDYGRRTLNISSNTGFSIGQTVVQTTNSSFQAAGTVYAVGSGFVRVKDVYNTFGPSGGSNSTLLVSGSSTNSSISTVADATPVNTLSSNYRYLPLRAGSFGFPKNPQGNIQDVIYDCLSFGRFEVGIIESLSGVDPGADYNVDPYVLVQQPEIAGFSRRDYVMEIANATSTFIVGEKINQTQANLTTYTLDVDYGAQGNSYTHRTIQLDASPEVSNTNDFIYYPSNTYAIDAGMLINPFTGAVEMDNDLVAADTVRYYTATGNTAMVTNNSITTVASANSSAFILTLSLQPPHEVTNAAVIVNNFISVASNPYANDDVVRYVVAAGNTAILGLSNNEVYYVVEANSTGLRLSNTLAGSVITLVEGASESGHALVAVNDDTGHNVVVYRNAFANTEQVLYTTALGNTALSGLSNNTQYYVVGANTIGFKLESSIGGGVLNITSGSSESGHVFNSIPGWLPLDGVYSNSGAYAVIDSVINNTVVVRGLSNGSITTGDVLSSNTNPYLTANVGTVDLEETLQTAKGVIKTANSSVITVKRIQFENTWQSNTAITGEVSGATAVLTTVIEDTLTLPIGLNANVEANVITADGQVTALKIIDSGFGYTNSEIVQFTSADGLRSGSAKVVLGDSGKGAGYYKSSKGFLSDSVCLHDGDYYQEYSYEIFSKLSVDRYSDMFKKVMHTAGTKFFGSARVVEEDSVVVSLADSSVEQE